jgi:hypothetical protein
MFALVDRRSSSPVARPVRPVVARSEPQLWCR